MLQKVKESMVIRLEKIYKATSQLLYNYSHLKKLEKSQSGVPIKTGRAHDNALKIFKL